MIRNNPLPHKPKHRGPQRWPDSMSVARCTHHKGPGRCHVMGCPRHYPETYALLGAKHKAGVS